MAQQEPPHPYYVFLVTTEDLVRESIDAKYADGQSREQVLATSLAESVFSQLKSPEAVEAVTHAFDSLAAGYGWPEGKGRAVHDTLLAELNFYNAKNDRNLAAAETVKSSIEDLLDRWLPEWLKKFLKLLNELLSLI